MMQQWLDAVQNADQGMIKKILKQNQQVLDRPLDRHKNTALMKAVLMDNATIVKTLLGAEANMSARDKIGRTPLMMANSPRIARMLIENGADIGTTDDDGNTLLRNAIIRNNREMIDFYIDEGVNPLQALFHLVNEPAATTTESSKKRLRTILQKYPEFINERDHIDDGEGETALIKAVSVNNNITTRMLLEAGSNVDYRDEGNWTALWYARGAEVAQLLVRHGADVNATDEIGETPLMRAVRTNNLPVARILLEHDADVNAHNRYGGTALMGAVRNKNMVELLLSAGADINAKTLNNQTAFTLAKDKEIKDILQNASRAESLDHLRKKYMLLKEKNRQLKKRKGIQQTEPDKKKGQSGSSHDTAVVHRIVGGELDYDNYIKMMQLLTGKEPPRGQYIPRLATQLLNKQTLKKNQLKEKLRKLDTRLFFVNEKNNMIVNNAFHRSVPYESLQQFTRQTGSRSIRKMEAANQFIKQRNRL